MSDDIVARLVRWHTAMANEPKRAESKRTKHRETIDLIWRLQADLSDARKSADFWKAEYLAGNYLIEQQATRIKELERDAERYRSLIDATEINSDSFTWRRKEKAKSATIVAEMDAIFGMTEE